MHLENTIFEEYATNWSATLITKDWQELCVYLKEFFSPAEVQVEGLKGQDGEASPLDQCYDLPYLVIKVC